MRTTRSVKCGEPGCNEYGHFGYDTQRDAREPEAMRSRARYRCTRHRNPDELLSHERREIVRVLEAKPSPQLEDKTKLFWAHGETIGSGFAHGNGYKAIASDFPVGTKLIVTVRIELPT